MFYFTCNHGLSAERYVSLVDCLRETVTTLAYKSRG